MMFTLKDNAGALNSALAFFETHSVSMTRIESRPSKRSSDYEFYVDFKGCETDHNVSALLSDLRMNCREVNMLHSYEVPWFPRKVREVDKLASKILDAGADLEADHPGSPFALLHPRKSPLPIYPSVFSPQYASICPLPSLSQ